MHSDRTRLVKSKRARGALGAVALALGAPGPARATVIVTALEVGGDVVLSGSGTLDLSAWTLIATTIAYGVMGPSNPSLVIGPAVADSVDEYFLTGPVASSPFGPGPNASATSGSGDKFGIANLIFVPSGYVSGDPLSGASTYAGSSFASLGMAPGSYTWSWGAGASADSMVLQVPEPSLAALAIAGAVGLALRGRRRFGA